MKRRSFIELLGAVALSPAAAVAQSSDRPIRIVVPLSAGTATDVVSRLLAPKLAATLGQPVFVDNKAGGNGLIGVQEVVRAAPDGRNLLMASVSSLAINMALLKNPPYDSRKDFTPISGAYTANHVWLVKSTFAARTFPEFIAMAKKNPGKVSVGSASTLVKIQLSALEKMAGIELLQVPYKALGAAVTDVLGGQIDMTLADTGQSVPLVKSGQMRALAVSLPKRNPVTPDWPAVAEFVPGFDFTSWTAMVGPAGMPRDIVARLSSAMAQALKESDVTEKFEQAGQLPWAATPDQLKSYIDTEVGRWTRLVKEANIEQE